MSKARLGGLIAALIAVAAVTGGMVGGGAAIALVKSTYNGPVHPDARSELAVHSRELGESMVLRIRLPVEYASDPGRRFSVVYVLDGPSEGSQIYEATRTLSRIGAAQPAIVVEVDRSGAGRTEDFTPPADPGKPGGGKADLFLRFLAHEAIPAVDDAFRSDSVRVLVGQSMGGLFVLYALAEQPALFDAFFAFSPSVWVGDEAILSVLQGALQHSADLDAHLYASLGSAERNEMLDGFEALGAVLRDFAPPGLVWHMEVTADADHGTNPELSYPVALSRYWGTVR